MREITLLSAEFSGPRKSDDVVDDCILFSSQCNICYKKTKSIPCMWTYTPNEYTLSNKIIMIDLRQQC